MRKWLVIAAVLAVAVVAGGVVIHRASPPAAFASLPVAQQNLAVYDAFWAAIDANYYEPKLLETSKMRELRAQWRAKAEAAKSIAIYWEVFQPLAEQFPHSHLAARPQFTAEDFVATMVAQDGSERARQAQKAFAAGAGFEASTIRRGGGTQRIVGDVLKGSTAAKAGITPGWKVVRAEHSFLFKEKRAVFTGEFMPGDAGVETRKIAFDLEPAPERRHFEVKRLAGDVIYIRFDLFGEVGEPDKVIAAIDSAGAKGLVLDLRGNVGGLNDALLRIAGRVLGNDVSIGTMRGRTSAEDQRTNAERHYSGPLVVLIGPTSASAAEVLAAAVQDYARGKVIGRASNGSVLAAKSFPLPDGGSVTVPVHDYLRIDGRHIESIGVEPDIEIVPTLADVRAGRDPVLERALLELARNHQAHRRPSTHGGNASCRGSWSRISYHGAFDAT